MPDLMLTNLQLLNALGNAEFPGGLLAITKCNLKSIKASYALTKAMRAVEGPAKDIDACRVKLAELHAKLGEDGKPEVEEGRITLADPVAFAAGWAELLAEEITLPGVRAVTLDELEGCGVTPQELLSAGPFVTES